MSLQPIAINNPDAHRFEITIKAATAVLEYSIADKKMTLHHTFVPTELRGQKIAGQLAKAAFDYARSEDLKIVPQCSYIETYIQRHPETLELI